MHKSAQYRLLQDKAFDGEVKEANFDISIDKSSFYLIINKVLS
jgi:hypothetical protein